MLQFENIGKKKDEFKKNKIFTDFWELYTYISPRSVSYPHTRLVKSYWLSQLSKF